MESKVLDFVIIGAHKGATTSLYKYLDPHPSICMPATKEAPFFTSDQLYEAGWDAFVNLYFRNADPKYLWGTSTPQYMCYDFVPERMHRLMPAVKLIALLRNPIDRFLSHYRMYVMRGWEKRSVAEILAFMNDKPVKGSPDYFEGTRPIQTCWYFSWSEYGRILSNYLKYFPRDQFLIIYTEALSADPKQHYLQILKFLRLPEPPELPDFSQRYRVGAEKHHLSPILYIKDRIKESRALNRLWNAVPENMQLTMRRWIEAPYYWMEERSSKKGTCKISLTDDERSELVAYFRPDVSALKKQLQIEVPWSEFV